MRCKLMIAAALLGPIATVPASAELVYKPYALLGTGYHDHLTADGDWSTFGVSHEMDGGRMLALYRAAELADQQGIAVIRVVDQAITVTKRRNDFRTLAEVATFTVRPVRSAADLTACKMRHQDRCLTLSVAKVMASYGPPLGQSAVPHTPGSAAAAIAYGAPASAAQVAMMRYLAQRPVVLPPALAQAVNRAAFPTAQQVALPKPTPVDPYEAGRQAARAALGTSVDP